MSDATTEQDMSSGEKARAEARKKMDANKFILARIRAAKAKRLAKRPKPRIKAE
jgi:hypothetical protein